MKELFERHQERMTDRERAEAWEGIEAGKARSRGLRAVWGRRPVAIGALALALLAAIIGLRILLGPHGPGRVDIASNLERAQKVGARDENAVTDGGTAAAPSGSESEAQRDAAAGAPARSAAGSREGGSYGEQRLAAGREVKLQEEPAADTRQEKRALSIPPPVPAEPPSEAPTVIAQASPESRVDVQSSSSEAKVDVKYEFKHRSVNTVADALSKENGVVEQDGQLYVRGGRANETKYFKDGMPTQPPALNGVAETPRAPVDAATPELQSTPPTPAPASNRGTQATSGTDRDKRGTQNSTWGGGRIVPEGSIKGLYDGGEARGAYPATGGAAHPNDEAYDAMFFQHYGVNPLIPTEEDSLSTFAVDVDAASYTVARRYIEGGSLPPPDAVRVEEFVNFFRQDYPKVADGDFKIHIDGAPAPFAPGYQLIRIGIEGRRVSEAHRKPARLVFVIDVSGSMAREDRLELVKRALRLLVDELNADDRVGIVTYGSTARVVLEPSSLEDREAILEAIDGLRPDGSTNAEEGLRLGYQMAGRHRRTGANNRLILCSDGVANVGATGATSILENVRSDADRGISLTTVGFGMGNFNDVLMEQLADKGDGNYYYVDDLAEARRVFVENLTGTLETIARDAKIQVEFDPRVVTRFRLLGFENRDVADADFRNDRVDAGEIGSGHEVTALYEVKLADRAWRVWSGRIATVRLRYLPPNDVDEEDLEAREIAASLDVSELSTEFGQAAPRLRLDAVVAEFSEILRGSYWAKGSRVRDLVPMARRLADELRSDPAVADFARLVEQAARFPDARTTAESSEDEGR
jgi:Ca-activated chloride channel family protein